MLSRIKDDLAGLALVITLVAVAETIRVEIEYRERRAALNDLGRTIVAADGSTYLGESR